MTKRGSISVILVIWSPKTLHLWWWLKAKMNTTIEWWDPVSWTRFRKRIMKTTPIICPTTPQEEKVVCSRQISAEHNLPRSKTMKALQSPHLKMLAILTSTCTIRTTPKQLTNTKEAALTLISSNMREAIQRRFLTCRHRARLKKFLISTSSLT